MDSAAVHIMQQIILFLELLFVKPRFHFIEKIIIPQDAPAILEQSVSSTEDTSSRKMVPVGKNKLQFAATEG